MNQDDKDTIAVLGWLLKHPKVAFFVIVICILAGMGLNWLFDTIKTFLGF